MGTLAGSKERHPGNGDEVAAYWELRSTALSYNQEMNAQQKTAATFFRPNDRAPGAMRPDAAHAALHLVGRGSLLIEVGHDPGTM